MAESLDWHREARQILRAHLARKEVSFTELAKALRAFGGKDTPRAVSNRVNRGSFSFVFFLQCMHVLNEEVVRLWDSKLDTPPIGIKKPTLAQMVASAAVTTRKKR
ncbi:MAG: DUF6471 domain-containing protein [Sterolibacterium sp.]|jgi:hypothetical protein